MFKNSAGQKHTGILKVCAEKEQPWLCNFQKKGGNFFGGEEVLLRDKAGHSRLARLGQIGLGRSSSAPFLDRSTDRQTDMVSSK